MRPSILAVVSIASFTFAACSKSEPAGKAQAPPAAAKSAENSASGAAQAPKGPVAPATQPKSPLAHAMTDGTGAHPPSTPNVVGSNTGPPNAATVGPGTVGPGTTSSALSVPLEPRLADQYRKPEPGAEPKITFDKMSHDFGEVDEGKELPAEFHFKNEGKGPLKILNTQPLCGCTLGELSVGGKPYTMGDPIAPGAEGVLKATLRTTGFSGEKKTAIKVLTNDPELPATPDAPFGIAQVNLSAMINKFLVFEGEGSVGFGSMPNTEPFERSLIVKTSKGQPFQVIGFEPADPAIVLSAEPTDETANRWKVKVSVPMGMALGPISRQFHVLTKPDAPSPLNFLVMGVIRGAIDLEPAQGLHFSVIPHGRPQMKFFTIRNRNPKTPMKIENIRLLDPTDRRSNSGLAPEKKADARITDNIEINLHELEAGMGVQMDVVIKETMPPGSFTTQLAFSTGVPGGPEEVKTMITGYVR